MIALILRYRSEQAGFRRQMQKLSGEEVMVVPRCHQSYLFSRVMKREAAIAASGTKLPILDVCCPVAIEGKADVARTPDFGSE